MGNFRVIVGNIGTVYDGASKRDAIREYNEYVDISLSGYGRAGGEAVTLIAPCGEDLKNMRPVRIDIELTDTFSGEANYSWVRRETIICDNGLSDLAIMRRIKAAIGLTGTRCRVCKQHGDLWEIRPQGLLQVCFAHFTDPAYCE